jgi:WD40 repeat protein
MTSAPELSAPELSGAAIANRDPVEVVIRSPSNPLCLAFSPDGTLLAIGSSDVVELTDASDGTVLRILQGHSATVNAVAFSPDGTLIATASWDDTARTWDTATGTHRTTLTGHSSDVNAVAFSPDGTLIATASADRTARTWDATSSRTTGRLRRRRQQQEIARLQGHAGSVTAVAFSPDGTLIATASTDRTARTWDTATGQHRTTLTGHNSRVTAVAFSPDGTLIATASDDGTTRIWDTATGTYLATLVALPDGGYATLLPDGRYKLAGDLADRVWWAIKLCRFEAGELDPWVPGIRRLAADEPVLPVPGARPPGRIRP